MPDEELVKREELDFFYSAISDTQSTIRVIDTKIALLLVFLTLPLSEAERIHGILQCINSYYSQFCIDVLIIIFATTWLSAIILSIFCIKYNNCPNKYYSGYRSKIHYYFTMLKGGISKFVGPRKKNAIHFENVYTDDITLKDIKCTLVHEHIKLSIIRDIKQARFNVLLRLLFIWITTGAIALGVYICM